MCEDVAFEFFPTVETILHVAHSARAGSVENQRKFATAVRHFELFPIGDAPLYDAAQLFEVDYSVCVRLVDDKGEGIVGNFALCHAKVVGSDELFLLVVERLRGNGHAYGVVQQQTEGRIFAAINRHHGCFRFTEGIKVGEFRENGLETLIGGKVNVVFVQVIVRCFRIGTTCRSKESGQ